MTLFYHSKRRSLKESRPFHKGSSPLPFAESIILQEAALANSFYHALSSFSLTVVSIFELPPFFRSFYHSLSIFSRRVIWRDKE